MIYRPNLAVKCNAMVIGDDAEIFAFSLFNVKKFQNQNQMNINENKVHLYPHYRNSG
jgi:hypothetical protein